MNLADIDKRFEKNMFKVKPKTGPQVIPTGSWIIDSAIGGGIPRQLITQISGPFSSGKTSLVLSTIAQYQKMVGPDDPQNKVLFIDAESTFKKEYAEQLGIDMSRVVLKGGSEEGDTSFQTGEQTFDYIRYVTQKLDEPAFGIIVVDSIPALIPAQLYDTDTEDTQAMGATARMLTKVLPTIINPIKTTNTALILINQLRENPGALPNTNPEYVVGGRQLGYMTSLHLEVRQRRAEKDKGEIEGWPWTIAIKKSKVNNAKARGSKVESFFKYGVGVDILREIEFAGPITGVLNREGNTFYYWGEPIKGVNGRSQLVTYLKENPDFYEEIKNDIRKVIEENPTIFVDGTVQEE